MPTVAPTPSLTRRELTFVKKLLVSVFEDPIARFRLQTRLISVTVAAIFGIIGGGFSFAPHRATTSASTYQLIVNIEGSLKVHGVIMMVLSAFVLYTSSEYRRMSQIALTLMGFYAMACGLLILGSRFLQAATFPAPWWYLLVAGLSLILVRVSPPVSNNRSRRAGRSGRA